MPRNRKHGGCITCRRRCRSCDKKRPACSQCANDGLVCGSYGDVEPQLAWVHATQETMRFNKGYFRPPSDSGSLPPSPPGVVLHGMEQADAETGMGHDVRLIVHDFLIRSATEKPFLNMFMSAAPPHGEMLPCRTPDLSADSWTAAVDEFCHAELCIRYAAEAMSTGVLSAISQSSQLWARSMQAYNHAVAELVKAFKGHRRPSQSEAVLATCRVLQTYELLFGQTNSWKSHLGGQLAIFLARGPDAFVSGQAHQLYLDSRLLVIILGLGKRVKSPLSTTEWRSVPWRDAPKSPMDSLLDITEDMIETFGQFDHLRACRYTGDVQRFRAIVLASCHRIQQRLHAWETDTGADVHTFDHTAADLPLPAPRDDGESRSLHIASVYWAVCLMLSATVRHAEASLYGDNAESAFGSSSLVSHTSSGDHVPRFHPHARNHPSTGPRCYAAKIAHSAHLLLNSANLFNRAVALFPIAMAAHFYASEKEEVPSRESQMLFDMLSGPCLGVFVGRFLTQLQGGSMESPAHEAQRRDKVWFHVVLN